VSLSDGWDSLLDDGDREIEIVYDWEKNIFYWADWSSQGRPKISCTDMISPTNQPRKDPYHVFSLSPHSPQFQKVGRGRPSLSLWRRPWANNNKDTEPYKSTFLLFFKIDLLTEFAALCLTDFIACMDIHSLIGWYCLGGGG
jgi:hypothetical protein